MADTVRSLEVKSEGCGVGLEKSVGDVKKFIEAARLSLQRS